MANAVLVTDMLRGFLEEGYPLYCGDRARRIIPNIQGLLEQELARGSKVFFICDNHDPDDLEFKMFPKHMPPEVPRISLIDTFKDEVEESVRVAQALGKKLNSVRLDTPEERGRVSQHLVKEVRAWLASSM